MESFTTWEATIFPASYPKNWKFIVDVVEIPGSDAFCHTILIVFSIVFRFHNAHQALFSVAQLSNFTVVHSKLGHLNRRINGQDDDNVSTHLEDSTRLPGRPPHSLSPTG